MDNQPKDLFPLIPGRDGSQNAGRSLRGALQDILDGEMYTKDVARYIVNYQIDAELKVKETAKQVLQISECLDDDIEMVENAAGDIMEQKASYLLKKSQMDSMEGMKEKARLHHCDLFNNLKLIYVDYFGLLQKGDMLPHALKRFLDFRYNKEIHLCGNCMQKSKTPVVLKTSKKVRTPWRNETRKSDKDQASQSSEDWESSETKTCSSRTAPSGTRKRHQSPIVIIPETVEFYDCEVGRTYKETVKLINCSPQTQNLVTKDFPKSPALSVYLDLKSKLASGMSCSATIVYKPQVYKNFDDFVSIRNSQGFVKQLPITVHRLPPRLITCVFKSGDYNLDRHQPGSARFQEKRQEALNTSVDCGGCLLGEYVCLTLFVMNKGTAGRFFIITEDEWCFENVESISTDMEYSSDCLWIYPTFFELQNEETIEIKILFYPYRAEMYLEKFFLMCNNNSSQQFEVLGDGVMFTKDILKIDVFPNDFEVNKKEGYCVVLGNFSFNASTLLILIVHNTSSVLLKCYWQFVNKSVKDVMDMDPKWIDTENYPDILPPYSTTDFKFKINLNTSQEGYHHIFFNFFVAEVPVGSLERGTKFRVTEKTASSTGLIQCVDVHVAEMEVACYIEKPKEEEVSSSESSSSSRYDKPPERASKMTFSYPFLEFGILPNDLQVEKEFVVKNLTIEPMKWKIVEVKYNIDTLPHMEVFKSGNISCDGGEFSCICQEQKIRYTVAKKGPVSWVSMLLLFSISEDNSVECESLCIVTYEIINYEVTVNGRSEGLALCPMKILYTGIPETITVRLENHSPIRGVFYFLKPFGDHSQYVNIQVSPSNGILKPFKPVLVDITISGTEVGIFEDVFIPCFISKGQKCAILRMLCAVDCVHLAMYLPGSDQYYQKIMWPPKVLFEYDDNWMFCPCSLEYDPEMMPSEMNAQSPTTYNERYNVDIADAEEQELTFRPGDNTPVASDERIIYDECLSGSKSEKTSDTVSKSDELKGGLLRELLQEQFGEQLFLQERIVEVRNIQLKTPTKITFYLENITPVQSKYTVDAINFHTNKNFDITTCKLHFKKAEDIWNDMITNEYGILVLPDSKEGNLISFGLVEVNLTVFSNTWGIYQEEIAVDVPDIPCFTFSLLVEVVGCPVSYPLATSKITEYPTVRFESAAYHSDEIQRKVKILNTSCVPVNIVWEKFMQALSKAGNKIKNDIDINNLFTITPCESHLEKDSHHFLQITMTPKNIPPLEKLIQITCSLIGNLHLEEHHRKKLNYFFRPTYLENPNQIRMEVLSALELPVLRSDFLKENITMRFYANEVIFDRKFDDRTTLVFHNTHSCVAEVEMSIDDPLEILDTKSRREGTNIYVVQPLSTLEITIKCNIDYQRILNFSDIVYPKKDADIDELKEKFNVQSVDTELKILHIQRNLTILHKGDIEKAVALDVYIYYPDIYAKPSVLRLDQIFLGNTRKTLVTVFNNTGYLITFEIFKSLASEVLYVSPHYGEIKKSTGFNKSFCNIFIYFTPREARQYSESIRIVTNIPNYFIEIPIKATGSINEKFYVDYKI